MTARPSSTDAPPAAAATTGAGTIGFLHTAEVHVATFEALAAEIASGAATVARVDPSLLADAVDHGADTPGLRSRIAAALADLRHVGADVVLCTCSTIAGAAEAAGTAQELSVVRVDRPLAEAAVASGPRLALVAALASTFGPTTELIGAVAAAQGREVELREHLVPGAWARFEAGDLAGYHARVAAACATVAASCDAIVLAQASMAGAAALVDLAVPVLTSPRLAVEATARALATR